MSLTTYVIDVLGRTHEVVVDVAADLDGESLDFVDLSAKAGGRVL